MQIPDGLKEILSRYERDKDDKEIRGNESQICESFIFPFFKKVLGWNTEDSREFRYEYVKSGKKADCLVLVDGIVKFVIEAKSMTVDIDNPHNYFAQAINYARSNQRPFSILTNFEKFIILYADNFDIKKPWNSKIGEVTIEQIKKGDLGLLKFFEKGYFLEKGDNNELFSKTTGKKSKPLSEELLEDLKTWRDILRKNLRANERKNNIDFENDKAQIEEEIQRFLDRLIFICFCEDKEMENTELKSHLDDKLHRFDMKSGFLLEKIKEIFHKYKLKYNSDLFESGLCDDFHLDDIAIVKILEGLKDPRDKAPYDFRQIPVEILGEIYENFIGITIHGEKRPKEEKDKSKRQGEGIYYTPQPVVNFIVNNTVREYIKNKTFEEIQDVKILDPACGSGSFLIKVFDVLSEESEKKIGRTLTYKEKEKLMLSCIYGVDKDERACDIAKLSLSLKLATRGEKIPELHNNIKNGNSLVEDKEIDENHHFKWDEKFHDIMKSGGFDIIVGNPPYVFTREAEFSDSFKKYVQDKYFLGMESLSKSHARQSGKINLYSLFLIRSINLLGNNDKIGFIVPNNLLRTTTYDIVRKFILDNCKILKIVDLGTGVFKGVTASTIIIILQKDINSNERNKNKINIISGVEDLDSNKNNVEQNTFISNSSYAFDISINKKDRYLFDKIKEETTPLGEIVTIHAGGIATGTNKKEMIENYKKNSKYKPMLEGKDIKPYVPNFSNRYILYDRNLLRRAREESIFLNPEKIVTQRIGGGNKVLVASYDDNKFYTFNSTNTILSKNKEFSLKYIVALLNSNLFNWYYVNKFTNKSNLTVNISKTFLENMPIKDIEHNKQKVIEDLVDKMISLVKELNEIGEKNKYKKEDLMEKIKRIDTEINEAVYKLYDITEAEKKVIEDSLNVK